MEGVSSSRSAVTIVNPSRGWLKSLAASILRSSSGQTKLRTCLRRREFRHAGAIVTPVKTGVHPHPENLDTVFQRYDGSCPAPGFPPFGIAQDTLSRKDEKAKVDFESTQQTPSARAEGRLIFAGFHRHIVPLDLVPIVQADDFVAVFECRQ